MMLKQKVFLVTIVYITNPLTIAKYIPIIRATKMSMLILKFIINFSVQLPSHPAILVN